MLVILSLTAFLISLVYVFIICRLEEKKGRGYTTVVFLFLALSEGGTFGISVARDISEAMLANRISHFDGTFLIPFFFLYVLDASGFRIPVWLRNTVIGTSTAVLLLNWSGVYHGLYYTSATLVSSGGGKTIEVTYGPFHIVYVLYLGLFLLGLLVVCMYNIGRRDKVSRRFNLMMMWMAVTTVSFYALRYATPVEWSYMSFAYIVVGGIMLRFIYRTKKYDIETNIYYCQEADDSNAYAVFDLDKRFIGCHESPSVSLWSLRGLDIDDTIPANKTLARERFLAPMNAFDEGKKEPLYYTEHGRIMEVTVKPFRSNYGGDICGYLLTVKDDTEHQNYMKLLESYSEELTREIEAAKVELEEKDRKMSDMRTSIMVSQIQPHFMYNTLTTIRSLYRMDPALAEETLTNFSAYIRHNIDSVTLTEPIPFEKELDHVKTYAAIEMIRFENIKVEYDILDTSFRLPALTIQPLVENAVKHGVRGLEDGRVLIKTFRKKGNHIVRIIDNGKGFDVASLPDGQDGHVGLSNVRERLLEMSGARMDIASEPGKGTTITITVPDRKEEAA